MATKAKKARNSRLARELLETAQDMHKSGLLTRAARDKITMRHLAASSIAPAATAEISGAEVKAIREEARLSQAVFARYLNVTAGYVSQLERGDKRLTGPALVLINVIRRKGIEAIL